MLGAVRSERANSAGWTFLRCRFRLLWITRRPQRGHVVALFVEGFFWVEAVKPVSRGSRDWGDLAAVFGLRDIGRHGYRRPAALPDPLALLLQCGLGARRQHDVRTAGGGDRGDRCAEALRRAGYKYGG